MSVRTDIDPGYAKEQAVALALADPRVQLRAFVAVRLTITPIGSAISVPAPGDPTGTLTEVPGLTVPFVLEVTTPVSAFGGVRFAKVFRRVVPTTFLYTPKEGGLHLFVASELYHNRFWGSLVLNIAGDPLRDSLNTP